MTALVVGCGLGLGLFLLLRGVRPGRVPLATRIAALEKAGLTRQERDHEAPDVADRFKDRFRLTAVDLVRGLGIDLEAPALTSDLRVTGYTKERIAVQKVLWGGVPVGAAMVLLLANLLGLIPRLSILIWLLLLFGLGGFLLPEVRLRRLAKARRQTFRNTLSAYLDLVAISLAGGAEPIEAMTAAVKVSSGWAFEELARSLALAKGMARKPWPYLGQLGEELGVPELAELTSSLGLADLQGASVKESLAAKAESLRIRRVTEAEGEANRIGEKMSIPIALLGLGFVLFLGYPALMRVLAGLG